MYPEITLFSATVINDSRRNAYDYKTVCFEAAKRGYVVDPKCDLNVVYEFLNSIPVNTQTTFYESMQDVISRDRFELFLDQIKHYASTYGTDFVGYNASQEREIERFYMPNASINNVPNINFENVKVISAITHEELETKIQDLVESGIALDQKTVDGCIELINQFAITIETDRIKNKEFLIQFILNSDSSSANKAMHSLTPVEFVRLLVTLYTDKTLLIKSPEVINKIRSTDDLSWEPTNVMREYGLQKLAEVFYRYKEIFLAIKGNSNSSRDLKKVINQIRRHAKNYHKPMEIGFWEKFLSMNDVELIKAITNQKLLLSITEMNNFKLVKLIQAIKASFIVTDVKPFRIRNGKLFVKDYGVGAIHRSAHCENENGLRVILRLLEDQLVSNLRLKAGSVKLPKNINLKMPSSEKAFIGNIPFGSVAWFDDYGKSTFGILWDQNSGANDLDLSFIDRNGQRYAWNARYRDNEANIVYSGDVTYPDPEATEVFWTEGIFPDGLFHLNTFSGDKSEVNYKLFLAKDEITDVQDPNPGIRQQNVLFDTMLSTKDRESIIGFTTGGGFYFINVITGSGRVSGVQASSTRLIEYYKKYNETYLDLERYLREAGFEINPDHDNVTYDLTTLDKSVIVSLLR